MTAEPKLQTPSTDPGPIHAVVRPQRLGPPTSDVAAAEAEQQRMARNRIGAGLQLKPDADAPALTHGVDAFRLHKLEQDVAGRRADHQAAQAAHQASRGAAVAKRTRKAVKAALARLNAASAALQAETHGEQAAAAVRRQDIVQDGVVLRETQVEMRGKRAELVPSLERLRARGTITEVEYRAGRRYREAWEMAGLDAFPIGLGGDGGRAAPASGNRRIEQAVGSSADLTAARHAIGVFGTGLIEHIVVHGLTLAAWAEKKAESEHVAKGYFRMMLTRLAEFWEQRDAQP